MSIIFHFLSSFDLVTASAANTVLQSLIFSCSTTDVSATSLLCHLASSDSGPLLASSSLWVYKLIQRVTKT